MEPSREQYPAATAAGVIAAAALCLAGAVLAFGTESSYREQNRDPYMIAAQETRLAPLRAVLPQSVTLGYLTDVEAFGVTDCVLFSGAQYVLAPRLMVRGDAPDLVLGDFSRPLDFAAFGESHHLRIRQDFGNGVVLYQREK